MSSEKLDSPGNFTPRFYTLESDPDSTGRSVKHVERPIDAALQAVGDEFDFEVFIVEEGGGDEPRIGVPEGALQGQDENERLPAAVSVDHDELGEHVYKVVKVTSGGIRDLVDSDEFSDELSALIDDL